MFKAFTFLGRSSVTSHFFKISRPFSCHKVCFTYVKPVFNTLTPFEKNFYKEHPEITEMTEDEVKSFRNKHEIKIIGEDIPKPITCFSKLILPDHIKSILDSKKFDAPTCIQAQGLPIAMSGQNLVGIAQTGTGKTLAYILPAIVHIKNQNRENLRDGPIGLVVAPTRELAQQIEKVVREFGKGIRSICVFGGSNRSFQETSLRQGVDLCIATPGRLLDFLDKNVTSLNKCSFVVLDEADRMLDMGFEPQIRQILDKVRPDKQILMWSATWPDEVKELAEEFLDDYVHINVGDSEELMANKNIEQNVEYIDELAKIDRVIDLFKNEIPKNEKVLVFANTKKTVDRLGNLLYRQGFQTLTIHGDRTQAQRDFVINDFKEGRRNILIATDVAARGLDVKDVKVVVNFDFPMATADYIHRIGRTGRMSKGKSYTLLTQSDAAHAKDLISILKKVEQDVPEFLHELASMRSEKKKYRNTRNMNSEFYSYGGQQRGSYGGQQRGSYGGQERGSYGGQERGSYGAQRGSYGAQRGSYGAQRGSYGAQRGSYGGAQRGSYGGQQRGTYGGQSRNNYEKDSAYEDYEDSEDYK